MSLYFTRVTALSEISFCMALCSAQPTISSSRDLGGTNSVFAFLCSPMWAFSARMRCRASLKRSSVILPSRYPCFMAAKSSSMSLKNRNMSIPAAMAAGIRSLRFMRQVRPTMWEASVSTMPLKPSFPRSRPPISSGDSVAGMISSSAIPGLKCLV